MMQQESTQDSTTSIMIRDSDFKERYWKYAKIITDGKYQWDDYNRESLPAFCKIMDPESKEKKGVLLMGPKGTGKSLMFKIAYRVIDRPFGDLRFNMYNALELCSQGGTGGWDFMKNKISREAWIDELGAESVSKVYGNEIDIIHDLVMLRYEKFQNIGLRTHFSTNLSIKMLVDRYGDRFVSRIREMCHFITVKGPDRRQESIPVNFFELKWPPTAKETQMQEKYDNYKWVSEEMKSLGQKMKEDLDQKFKDVFTNEV